MPYPSGTVKTVIGGQLPSGEAFAFGFQADGDPGMGQLALTNYLGVVSGALTGNFLTTPVKLLFNTAVKFQTVRAYLYTGGDKATLVAENTGINTSGTSNNASLPDQLAICVSLRTGQPGRSKRGRAYLPSVTSGSLAGNTTLITNADVDTLASAFASMLSAVKDSANGLPPVVASATTGSMTPITGVTIDNVWDTQRRRRNKVVATHVGSGSVS